MVKPLTNLLMDILPAQGGHCRGVLGPTGLGHRCLVRRAGQAILTPFASAQVSPAW